VALQILAIKDRHSLHQAFTELKVDPYGIEIMLPKAIHYLIRARGISCIAATILKQEMLSLGAEAALPREALTGGSRKTDCLLIGSRAHFEALIRKLAVQPFGLATIGQELRDSLKRFEKPDFVLRLPRQNLRLGAKPLIMGIINLTPDSFSGDGLYGPGAVDAARELALRMTAEGADILDIGGESSRPGARAVSAGEELRRTIPVIKAIARHSAIPLSIDTCKPEVAHAALENGASIVNDITGLKNSRMRALVRRYRAGAVIMHMRGNPRTMQKQPVYTSLISDLMAFFRHAIGKARETGIPEDALIIDPGIGFGKTLENNLEILSRLEEFKILGLPILVGVSRKSFIGKILGTQPQERIIGSVASCVVAASRGAHILRVHDVKETAQALKITRAIIQTKRYNLS
jgi:dihydropteroate synthase